jgi:hypothetical protein
VRHSGVPAGGGGHAGGGDSTGKRFTLVAEPSFMAAAIAGYKAIRIDPFDKDSVCPTSR